MNRGAGRAPRAIAMEFAFHNRFFRPALPLLRRALIQTGVSLCSVPNFCSSSLLHVPGAALLHHRQHNRLFRPTTVPFQARVPPFLCPPSVSHGLRPRSRTQGRRHLRRTQGRHHLCHTPRGPAPPTPTLHFASTSLRLSRGRVPPLLGFLPSRAPVSLPLSPCLIALCGRAPRARACLPRSMRPARLCRKGRSGAQGTAVRAKGGRRGRRRC